MTANSTEAIGETNVKNAHPNTKPYSEETARKIDEQISLIIEKQYKRACAILKKNKTKLSTLASRLLEKEVIFKEDLVKILGERPHSKEEIIEKNKD